MVSIAGCPVSRAVRMFFGQLSRVTQGEAMRPMKTIPASAGIVAGSCSSLCSPSRASNISRGPVILPISVLLAAIVRRPLHIFGRRPPENHACGIFLSGSDIALARF